MSQHTRQSRFSRMYMMTLSIGVFLSAETVLLSWLGMALDANNSPAPLEYLEVLLGYQSFIWGTMVLIQGSSIRQHTTFGWAAILTWGGWTVLYWSAFWLILFVYGLNSDPVLGLSPYTPLLFFGGLVGIGLCQWLGAMILNQRICWMSWRWWGVHFGVIGGIFLVQYAFLFLDPLLPESFWVNLLVVLVPSLMYGLSIGFVSKDIIPTHRLRTPRPALSS